MRSCLFLLILTLICCGSLSVPLYGEVYSLWPFSGSGSSAETLSGAESRNFWKEKIRVNGTDMELEIFLLERTLKDVAGSLRKDSGRKQNVYAAGNSLLVEEAEKNGSVKRTFYLELPGVHSLLQFQMILPPGRRTATRNDWTKELPLIADAEDMTCMEFPVRRAVFGAFLLKNATVPQVLSDLTVRIRAMGWEQVSREADDVFTGSGEVFLKHDPYSIMILGVTAHNDGVRVSMYSRPIEKK